MSKIWVDGREYLKDVINYNDKRFLEFRSALINGIKKEVNNKVPILSDPIKINVEIKRMLENPNTIIRVLTNQEKTHIYGLFIAQISEGFFTGKALSFPLTTLTKKADKKDIFRLMKECKKVIKNNFDKVDYVMLETVLKDGKIVAHNKKVLEWFDKNINKAHKLYEIWVSKIKE